LFICILSIAVSWVLYTGITVKNQEALKEKSNNLYYAYTFKKPKFDYINGLWLAPVGVFFTCFLVFLNFPSYGDIYNKFKKDYKTKMVDVNKKTRLFMLSCIIIFILIFIISSINNLK